VLAKGKGNTEAVTRRDYKIQIVSEILTGFPQDNDFFSPAMEHGIQMEPAARDAYRATCGLPVTEIGLVIHPLIPRGAASPDGLVGTNGLVEIKAPKMATHLGYLLSGEVPSDYIPQMAWQMACTEREWCDFVSFDDRFPKGMQLFVIRYERDEEKIKAIEEEVNRFLAEVDAMANMLKERFPA
jgi:putative phage-type endonuclease